VAIEEREIAVAELAVGMYVCRLDRPWSETPFPLQGFLVRDRGQLGLLREYCSRVWVDTERAAGRGAGFAPAPAALSAPAARQSRDPELHRWHHADTASLDEEAPAARAALEDARRIAEGIVDTAAADPVLCAAQARVAAEPIVASVLRNADALFWVNALRERDAYAYSHALGGCMLAAAFGRHLGLPQQLLVHVACGALLMDIGKTRVPEAIIRHPGPLNPLSMARARRHVELGLQILEESGGQHPIVRQVLLGHHERFDGSGYPERLRGMQIPVYARMAAIVDSFDAMTSDRPYASAMSRHDALQALYRGRDTLYHGELVEQFISCMGVYPTGSLVELDTGEVAVVMAQNPSRRLRPRLMVITGRDGRMREAFRSLDLAEATAADAPRIRRPLAPGECAIDLSEFYL
jgi:HD-GYP domain-containing protein (c-di-GMP phosphodiesterase class II)